MADFLRALVEIVHYLWPVRVVWSYELGVRFVGGKTPKQINPGVYFFVPFFMRIETLSIAQDTIDLPFQSITTKDKRAVDVSVNFAFRITDAVAYYTNVQDFETNFPRLAARHVMSKVRGWSFDELLDKQAEFERSMRDTFNTRMAKHAWGAELDDAGFTDLVLTRQYRLHGHL